MLIPRGWSQHLKREAPRRGKQLLEENVNASKKNEQNPRPLLSKCLENGILLMLRGLSSWNNISSALCFSIKDLSESNVLLENVAFPSMIRTTQWVSRLYEGEGNAP